MSPRRKASMSATVIKYPREKQLKGENGISPGHHLLLQRSQGSSSHPQSKPKRKINTCLLMLTSLSIFLYNLELKPRA